MTDNNRKEDENLGSFYMGRMRPPPEPERILPRGLLTAIVVFAFAGILWYAYPQGAEKYTDVDVPVVKAEVSPYKFAPEDPGGMEVRHRDSTVFDSLETAPVKKVEKILPAGEAPLDRKTVLGETSPALNLDPQLKDTVTAPPSPAPAAKTAAATPAPKPETVGDIAPAAGGDTFIQLGSYRDPEGAAKAWKEVKDKYASLLSGIEMRTEKVDLGAKGTFHRLQAGAFTEAGARQACETLRKTEGGCFVVKQ